MLRASAEVGAGERADPVRDAVAWAETVARPG